MLKCSGFLLILLVLCGWQGPAGARVYADTKRDFRGSQFINQTWDKSKDVEFATVRKEMDALWKSRKSPKPGAIVAKFHAAYQKWRTTKSKKDLYRANILAFITRWLDRDVRVPTDLDEAWNKIGNYGSLELARSFYLLHTSGRVDDASLIPLAKLILLRSKNDDMVEVRFCIDASIQSIKDRPYARQIAGKHLDEAYTDVVWCETAAIIVGSHAYKSSDPAKDATLAYQLILRFEQLTGRTMPLFKGSAGLVKNWKKARPNDPALDAAPWMFGPKKGQKISRG